jgi:signal transduction histidine kinase/CheY-like chemotaxis protein
LPWLTGAAAALLGALVLAGWWGGPIRWVQLSTGQVPMQANTAASLVLAGLGLVAVHLGRQRAAALLGGAVLLIALLTFVQYPLGVDLGIDRLLTQRVVGAGIAAPGRMEANTAVALALIGAALLLPRRFGFSRAILGSLTLALGAVALIGYLAEISSAYAWGGATGMGLHTAVGLVLLGTGLLAVAVRTGEPDPDWRASWPPLVAGLAATLVGLLFWQALRLEEESAASRLAAVAMGGSLAVGILLAVAIRYAGLASRRARGSEEAVRSRTAELRAALALLEAENLERRRSEEAQAALARDNARLYDGERRARAEAQAASRAKDRFLAILSHELRNPLAAVRTSLGVLDLGGGEPERDRRMREILARQVAHLTRLVDDLLDISRIEQGTLTLDARPLDLARLIAEAAEAQRASIEKKGIRLDVRLPGELVWITGDATRLVQVVANLLVNARRFTPPSGSIRVELTAAVDRALLSVGDSGRGIAAEDLPRIFEPFAMREKRQDEGRQGLGLGLSIVERLVAAHGGEVEASSEGPGRGAEFRISLPRIEDPTLIGQPSPGAVSRARRRILVVEDDPDEAVALVELLRIHGHRVEVALDAPSGIEIARHTAPEVVICDLALPGMDGCELARELRRHPETAGILLLALTGFGDEDSQSRTRAAGFDRHLLKPVAPEALLELLGQERDPSYQYGS